MKHFSVNRGKSVFCLFFLSRFVILSLCSQRDVATTSTTRSTSWMCKPWPHCLDHRVVECRTWTVNQELTQEKNQAHWFLNYRHRILSKELDITIAPAAGVEAADATSFPRPPKAHAAQQQDDGCLHFYTSGSRPPRWPVLNITSAIIVYIFISLFHCNWS